MRDEAGTMEMIWLLLLLLALGADADEDCRYSERPQFPRNTSTLMIVDGDRDVQLSFCEATNACHVEWFKDGKKLIFNDNHVTALDARNEQILLQPAQACHSGNYTCVVSNNMGTVNRTVEIRVDEGITRSPNFGPVQTPNWPLRVGGSYWYRWTITIYRVDANCKFVRISDENFIPNCPSTKHESVCGECTQNTADGEIMYATLKLSNVREEDLGEYRLLVPPEKLEFSVKQNRTSRAEVETNDVVASVAPLVLIMVFLTATWRAFGVNIQLYVKDHFKKPEAFDGRSYDAYISYTCSDVDRLFVLHLKNHLERQGYRVYVPEEDNVPGGCTVSQLVEALQQSRRFIMVLSPGYFRANFTHYEVNMFIEALDRYKDCIIPIVFGDSGSMDSNGIFRHVIKVGHTIKWTNIEWPLSDPSIIEAEEASSKDTTTLDNCHNARVAMEKSFKMRGFKQLLLRLPPRPKRSNKECLLV